MKHQNSNITNSEPSLPGGEKPVQFLKSQTDLRGKSVLITGGGTIPMAQQLKQWGAEPSIIVEHEEDLLELRVLAAGAFPIKFMLYEKTDFEQHSFDVVFSQAALSIPNRGPILKEFKRILKPGGLLCSSEIVSLTDPLPGFVSDMLERAGIHTLILESFLPTYETAGYILQQMKRDNAALKDYYRFFKNVNKYHPASGLDGYTKKLLKRAGHEATIFMKLGGEKHLTLITGIFKIAGA